MHFSTSFLSSLILLSSTALAAALPVVPIQNEVRAQEAEPMAKIDYIYTQKKRTPEDAKIDYIYTQKKRTPEDAKIDYIYTQKKRTPDAVKIDYIYTQAKQPTEREVEEEADAFI